MRFKSGVEGEPKRLSTEELKRLKKNFDEYPTSIGETPQSKREGYEDHKREAYGRIDGKLEAGTISPEEAQKMRDQWDRSHSQY
jgi:hypothetical protein